MRKRISILLVAALFIFTSGCSSLMTSEYLSIKEHKSSSNLTEIDSSVIDVKTNQGIKTAISTFVKEGREQGVLKVSGFDGDVPEAISNACREIAEDTAIGAYCVERMTQSYTKTLTNYLVTINIFYKHTKEQIQGIVYLNNVSAVQASLGKALSLHKDYLVISISSETINEQFVKDYVTQFYRSEPKSIIALPSVHTTVYSKPSLPRILEIQITYPFFAEQDEAMKAALINKATKTIAGSKSASDSNTALKACISLISAASFSQVLGSPTAYGTIMDGAGNSEGYAMAYKLLCSMLGVKCTVVEGLLNGTVHYWNIIGIDNDFYHVDPSACELYGMITAFLKTDVLMRDALYRWDTVSYEACKGTLTYNDLV